MLCWAHLGSLECLMPQNSGGLCPPRAQSAPPALPSSLPPARVPLRGSDTSGPVSSTPWTPHAFPGSEGGGQTDTGPDREHPTALGLSQPGGDPRAAARRPASSLHLHARSSSFLCKSSLQNLQPGKAPCPRTSPKRRDKENKEVLGWDGAREPDGKVSDREFAFRAGRGASLCEQALPGSPGRAG